VCGLRGGREVRVGVDVGGEGDCALDGRGDGGLQGCAGMMSPVALLLVKGGEVVQEEESVVYWLDGELPCRGRLGRSWEMDSLHCLAGTGEERGEGGIFLGEPFDGKLVGLEQLDQWSRPNVQSPSLAIFGKCIFFW